MKEQINKNLFNNTRLAYISKSNSDLIKSYLSESEIAVDTELHGLKLFRDDVCLVQICDDKNNVSLIKPINNQVDHSLFHY